MSADNGVYIGEFPLGNGSLEYRVIHAQNIEDCFDDIRLPTALTDDVRILFFKNPKAEVFSSYGEAFDIAAKHMARKIREGSVLEYGVRFLAFDRPLSDKPYHEAEEDVKNFWSSYTLRDGDNHE